MRIALGLTAALVFLPSSPPSGAAPPDVQAASPHPDVAIARAVAIETRGLTALQAQDLDRLYSGDTRALLWFDASGRPTPGAKDVVQLLVRAADDGLDPGIYGADRLAAVVARADPAGAAAARPPDEAAADDVALSSALVRHLHHLHFGRVDPRTLGFRVAPTTEGHDIAQLVMDARARRRVHDMADALRPPLDQYARLRDALAHYRTLEARAQPALPAMAAPIRPGDRHPAIPIVAERLRLLGDLAPTTALESGNLYDAALEESVRRFQERHGLAVDGIIGRATTAALAVPVAQRARQITLALERLRWLPDLAGPRLVAINIPMFRLFAWSALPGRPTPDVEMNVIVGRALDTQTPVFTASLEEVVFRPFWNVPRSIVRGELMPRIDADAGYLDRERYQIVRGTADTAVVQPPTPENIERLRRGDLQLRQRPGPGNALGLVKFVFPNALDVYMHDTPARQLFGRPRRDFSHGCVRLEDPIGLAVWALDDETRWSRDRVEAAMHADRDLPLHERLDAPIPVVLFYQTAVVSSADGLVRFADDLYGHDARLVRALAAGGRE